MKTHLFNLGWLVASALVILRAEPLVAVTAEDFGFVNMQVNGQPVSDTIPLLVVTFELPTDRTGLQKLTHDNNYFDQLIFNPFAFPSLNGYFLENSRGTFYWRRAAVLGPVMLTTNEATTLAAKRSSDGRGGIDSSAGTAYLLELIAAKTAYDFSPNGMPMGTSSSTKRNCRSWLLGTHGTVGELMN